VIRLHDLRHTHATLLLADGVPVKVVSERLGHASATITLTVPSTCTPAWAASGGPLRRAARGLIRRAKYHAGITRASEALTEKHPGLLTCRHTGMRLCPRGCLSSGHRAQMSRDIVHT
jgi:hypothetical protein